MIIYKCDICNKKGTIFDSIVLYSKSIDYCRECKEKAEKIKQEYKRELECQIIILESKLKTKENNIIKKLIARNNRGVVIKEN